MGVSPVQSVNKKREMGLGLPLFAISPHCCLSSIILRLAIHIFHGKEVGRMGGVSKKGTLNFQKLIRAAFKIVAANLAARS